MFPLITHPRLCPVSFKAFSMSWNREHFKHFIFFFFVDRIINFVNLILSIRSMFLYNVSVIFFIALSGSRIQGLCHSYIVYIRCY